jgi:UDP-glucose 4-epimerase
MPVVGREDPNGVFYNSMLYTTKAAIGKLKKLSIIENDYNASVVTDVRDYIHVVGLTKGHIAALDYLGKNTSIHRWKLGADKGCSELEMIEVFE